MPVSVAVSEGVTVGVSDGIGVSVGEKIRVGGTLEGVNVGEGGKGVRTEQVGVAGSTGAAQPTNRNPRRKKKTRRIEQPIFS
jgi:hypothetical protein